MLCPSFKVGGRVTRGDGRPTIGTEVLAVRQGSESVVSTTVAEDGSFVFEVPEEGCYRVCAFVIEGTQRLTAESWTNTGVTDLQLRLTPSSGTLRIRVLSPDRIPVPRFDARLLSPNGYMDLGTGADGTLTLKGEAEQWAHADLEVWGARDTSDHGLPYAPVRVGPLALERSEVDIRMQRGAVVEGVVLGQRGPFAESFEIELRPLDRWWETIDDDDLIDAGVESPSTALPQRLPHEGLKTIVRTDEAGRFRVAFFRDIVHELSVNVPRPFLRIKQEVRVSDNPLELRVRSPTHARVTVVGPELKPVKGAYVRLMKPGENGFGSITHARTNAQGVAVLERVDPERTYKLTVNPYYEYEIIRDPTPSWHGQPKAEPRKPPFLAEYALEHWIPAETTIQLEKGYMVSGQVLDTNDLPVKNCHVGMCTSVGFGVYSTTHDGSFEFHGVPAGVIYMGLDDGGDMGGIVDRQRETMWDASYGPRERYSLDSPPPVRKWTRLNVIEDLTDVTFRLPATISATVVIPKTAALGRAPKGFSRQHFDATRVAVIRLTEEGWDYFRSLSPVFSMRNSRRLTLDGLVPGDTYAAWMTPVDGEYVYVEFPAEVGSLVLKRRTGGAIDGRIVNRPKNSSRVRISITDNRRRWLPGSTPDSEGRFRIEGLPDSNWTVRVWCRAPDDVVWKAEETVSTGEDVQLRLAPFPPKNGK